MKSIRALRWPAVVAAGFLTASAPVTMMGNGAVRPQTAVCQTGTCCPEDKSTCVIGSSKVTGYYQIASGSCKNES